MKHLRPVTTHCQVVQSATAATTIQIITAILTALAGLLTALAPLLNKQQ